MTTPLPAALKAADVQRFATRSEQLRKYKPIVTYWLEYYILQRILGGSLHTTSDEVSQYAIKLMDKLEETKESYAAESAVVDDTAAKAYMEQFASDTFARAEQAQNSGQTNRQTADTFQAAATFFDSLSIWGELDVESKAKSKFAKFHALRIARAIKEGKDPNETNPKVELPPSMTMDDEDAELAQLEKEAQSTSNVPPKIGDIPDAISPEDADTTQSASIGGGYFPSVPSTTGQQSLATPADLAMPHIDEETHVPRQATVADMMSPNIDDETHIPQQPAVTSPPADPTSFYSAAPVPAPVAAPVVAAAQSAPRNTTNYITNDDAVLAATKHAKWAISALNFEDVPTAVEELRIALRALGGL